MALAPNKRQAQALSLMENGCYIYKSAKYGDTYHHNYSLVCPDKGVLRGFGASTLRPIISESGLTYHEKVPGPLKEYPEAGAKDHFYLKSHAH